MTSPEKTMANNGGRTYLTIAQATERSTLSRSTLYVLMNAGALEFTKVGRCRRIPLDALMKVMEDGTVPARTMAAAK